MEQKSRGGWKAMHNHQKVTLLGAILLSYALFGCASDVGEAGKEPSASLDCADESLCTVSGTLDYKSRVFGAMFRLQAFGDEENICVARDGVSVDDLSKYAGKKVSLTGRFEDFIEFEDCAFINFGDSKLPCGACGDRVFVATGIAK